MPSSLHCRWIPRTFAVLTRTGRLEGGQGMVEYGVIITLVALVAAVGLQTFGQAVLGMPAWDVVF